MGKKRRERKFFCGILLMSLFFFAFFCYHKTDELVSLSKESVIVVMKKLNGETENKKIAITFDDGPHPYYTEQLLDGLKERDAKATFFLTGEHAEQYPELVKRMYEEGHLIGNHTYSHLQLGAHNREAYKEELLKTNEILEEIIEEEIQFVRPPYGSWDKSFEAELSMFPVLWSIDPQDWCSSNVAGIVNSVLSKADENDIILMHDEYKSTITAAFTVIDELQKRGYEFVTVDEILFD